MIPCKKMHPRCKAGCCKICPIEKEIFDRNREKIVEKTVHEILIENPNPEIFDQRGEFVNSEYMVPITESTNCCFLNSDYTCNIYEDRPYVCKKFGDESSLWMNCLFCDKNGKERSRQEKRSLERKMTSAADKLKIIGENFQ